MNNSDLWRFGRFHSLLPFVYDGTIRLGRGRNYIDGVMTKPYSINEILRYKYYFFIILNLISHCFGPFALIHVDLLMLMVSILIFSIGFINIFMLPMCLFSQKVRHIRFCIFNFQGANYTPYSFAMIILSFS